MLTFIWLATEKSKTDASSSSSVLQRPNNWCSGKHGEGRNAGNIHLAPSSFWTELKWKWRKSGGNRNNRQDYITRHSFYNPLIKSTIMTDINVMIIIYRVPQKKFLLDFFLNVCSLLISCCRFLILLFAVIRSRHKEREMSRQSREILKGTFFGTPCTSAWSVSL